jgi:hypothetical protein
VVRRFITGPYKIVRSHFSVRYNSNNPVDLIEVSHEVTVVPAIKDPRSYLRFTRLKLSSVKVFDALHGFLHCHYISALFRVSEGQKCVPGLCFHLPQPCGVFQLLLSAFS